jgi:hypothetical protein
MSTKEISLSSPIEKKIVWADYYLQEFGGQLLKDESIVDLLNRLKSAIYSSHREMADAAIANICRECEQNEGGSCCGAGLENKYDGWLLLINLLLEAGLPRKKYDPESCFFLGETGCFLKARHVICVNYLCKKITDRIDPHKIMALQEKEGEELRILFFLNERIKKVIRSVTGHRGTWP